MINVLSLITKVRNAAYYVGFAILFSSIQLLISLPFAFAEEIETDLSIDYSERYEPIDLSSLSPSTLQAKLGSDVSTLATYVRSSTRFVPYLGVFRGATGTLLSQAGNSADRSILLSSLLTHAGYATRFARTTLTKDQAEQILQKNISKSDKTFNIPTDFLISINNQFTQIQEALSEAGITPTSNGQKVWEGAVEATQNHVWVQYQLGEEWVDIDPEFEVSTFKSDTTFTALPIEYYHKIHFSLRVNTENEKGEEIEITLLNYDGYAKDLAESVIGFQYLIENNQLESNLYIDSEIIEGKPVQISLNPKKDDPAPREGFGGLGGLGGLGDALSGLDGLSRSRESNEKKEAPKENQERPFGLYFDLSFKSPYGTQISTHTVFEEESTEELPNGLFKTSAVVLSYEDMQASQLIKLLKQDEKEFFSIPGLIKQLHAIGDIYSIVRSRLHSFIKPVLHTAPQTNVSVVSIISENNADPVIEFDLTKKSYDIVSKNLDVWDNHFNHMVMNGLLDHELEYKLISNDGAQQDVGELIQVSQTNPTKLSVVEKTDQLLNVFSKPGRKRIESALSNGLAVITLSKPPHDFETNSFRWWEINPVTGETQDVDGKGRHGVSADHSIGLHQKTKQSMGTRVLSCTVQEIVIEVAVGAVSQTLTLALDPTGVILPEVLDITTNNLSTCNKSGATRSKVKSIDNHYLKRRRIDNKKRQLFSDGEALPHPKDFKKYRTEDLKLLLEDAKYSVNIRKGYGTQNLSHERRKTAEQELIRRIEKYLSGS